MLKKLATIYIDEIQEKNLSDIAKSRPDTKKRAINSRIFSEGLNMALAGKINFGADIVIVKTNSRKKAK